MTPTSISECDLTGLAHLFGGSFCHSFFFFAAPLQLHHVGWEHWRTDIFRSLQRCLGSGLDSGWATKRPDAPDMMLSIQAKEWNLCFIRPENFVSHLIKRKGSHLIALQVPFGKLQLNYHVAFTKQSLPSGHCIIQAWVECSKNTCPSGKFSSLHRATLDFCQWPLGCW